MNRFIYLLLLLTIIFFLKNYIDVLQHKQKDKLDLEKSYSKKYEIGPEFNSNPSVIFKSIFTEDPIAF